MTRVTIGEILDEKQCITGGELEGLLSDIMADETANEVEKSWAQQIHEDYWVNNGDILPISTAYYSLWMNKKGAIRIRRDTELSPRVSDFMDCVTCNAEDDCYVPGYDLRAVIACKFSIKGNQLKELCEGILSDVMPITAYYEYQKQLAQAILDKYYTDESKVPKDNYYYKVQVKQVGVPNILRDLERSPRPLSAAEKEWNAAHPDEI